MKPKRVRAVVAKTIGSNMDPLGLRYIPSLYGAGYAPGQRVIIMSAAELRELDRKAKNWDELQAYMTIPTKRAAHNPKVRKA